jgi:hypothetical protein
MNETGDHPYYPALFKELRRLGYVEGKNLIVARYSGEGREDRYPELCRDVVGTKPDGYRYIRLPPRSEFQSGNTHDPSRCEHGRPRSLWHCDQLARPGGNITGVSVEAGLEIWVSVCKSCAKPFRQRRRWGSSVRAKYGTYPRSPRRGRPPLKWATLHRCDRSRALTRQRQRRVSRRRVLIVGWMGDRA